MRPPYTKPRGKLPTPRGPKLTFPTDVTFRTVNSKPADPRSAGVARAVNQLQQRDWLLGGWRHEP
jgi:hypothetical protein